MKQLTLGLIIAVLMFGFLSSPALAAANEENQVIRISGIVCYVDSLDTYGIMGNDGKQYQPIKQLPREYQTDGLEVVATGKLHDDIINSKMWGNAFEVLTITKTAKYIGPEEREAIRLLVERMSAFNAKDLGQLQKIDVVARGLSAEQFNDWLGNYGNFTLRYVETGAITKVPDQTTISGLCLYSRQLLNGMALSGNTNYTTMRFTLSKIGDGWKFTATASYMPDDVVDPQQYIKDLLARAEEKYGTTDLAAWKG